ncbi:MAG TPA: CDP-alcohol phosphatidyltransferase family protein [Anaerolineae bacterium]|nr:CDP-alcohol phosphatidyltransferase family protein [Anaerolineae bacterium]
MITKLVRRYTMWITEPIARFFIFVGASPNHVTLLGLLLMAGVAVVIALGHLRVAGLLILIAAGADGVDGVMARLQDRTSRFGAFFDSSLDRYSEALTLLGLFVFFQRQGDLQALSLIYVAIVGSLMVSYTRARAESLGLSCQRGILTRVERVIVLIVTLLLGQARIGLWILAVLSNFTALQRIYFVWKASNREEPA